MLPPGGVGEPLIGLPSALAMSRPAGRHGHLQRDGSEKGKGRLAGRRVARSRGPKEEQCYRGVPMGSLGWHSFGQSPSRPCCYACCYSRVSRPVASLSRPVYVAISPPEIQEVPKARGERALWRVLTRADLSSQIEAPVGVGPTMADLQSAALATWLRRLVEATP